MGQIYDAWKEFKEKKISLIAATAVTNFTIPIITHLTSTLQLDHPLIKDLDHIIMILYFQKEIHYLMTKIRKPVSYEKAVEMMVLSRHVGDPTYYDGISDKFCKICEIDEIEAAQILAALFSAYMLRRETIMSWSKFLGRTCMIEVTQVSLVKFNAVFIPGTILKVKADKLGTPWNEKTNLCSGTNDLTRDFLIGKFLPIALCAFPIIISNKLPNQKEIMPLVALIAEFVETRKVSIPLVFAFHAMMMAHYAVQGDMACTRLAIESSNEDPSLTYHLFKSYKN